MATSKQKRKYRADGTPLWSKRTVGGPGVWVTCVKGKEKQTAGELYDLFESLAEELWPADSDIDSAMTEDPEDEEMSIEEQVASQVAVLKKPRRGQRFANCQTSTPCVVFISCKPPVDPVKLVLAHVVNVERTGVGRTRYTQRLVPVSDTCVASISEIRNLCRRVFASFFAERSSAPSTYKIELRMRNHTTLSRETLIPEIVRCVPEDFKVDLADPKLFILVEVFKSVCGVSVVEDYYHHQKFNVMEIANARNSQERFLDHEGRIRNRVTG